MNTARIYAGRAGRVIMCAELTRLTIPDRLVLLQVHHTGDITIAVSQTIRGYLMGYATRWAAGTLVHLDSPADGLATAG
jgi:hypothetical protein